jgi:hypothetical protein
VGFFFIFNFNKGIPKQRRFGFFINFNSFIGPFYKELVILEATLYQLKLWRAILQMTDSLEDYFILFPHKKKHK